MNKLFDRFYRLDCSRNRKTGGSGLGLNIAKSIVEAHGGSIKAFHENGITCFTVIL
jgi:signal transduction histidine kinase